MYYYEFVNLKNRGCFLRGKIRVFDEIGGYFRLGIPRIGGYFQNPRQSVYPLAQLSGGAGDRTLHRSNQWWTHSI